MILIDYSQLEPDTLENVLKEICLREGTDYGEISYTLDDKVQQLKILLESGSAVIVYDATNNHCEVLAKTEVPKDI